MLAPRNVIPGNFKFIEVILPNMGSWSNSNLFRYLPIGLFILERKCKKWKNIPPAAFVPYVLRPDFDLKAYSNFQDP